MRTAFILDSDRFDTPNKRVASFGTLPIEMSSGVDRDGQPRGSRRYVRSKRGHDLVRRYLWMAALAAVRCNPAVRARYRRAVAECPDRQAIAIGHARRKLLHLALALWQSDQPLAARHYPGAGPASGADGAPEITPPPPAPPAAQDQAAGHKPESKPARTVVTAACAATVPPAGHAGAGTCIGFAHRKRQLPMARVLEHLGLSSRRRGRGPQRRCAGPIHVKHGCERWCAPDAWRSPCAPGHRSQSPNRTVITETEA